MKNAFLAPFKYPFAAFLGACFAAMLMVIVPAMAHSLEPILFPVNSEWKVTRATVVGNDLILEGTMKKNRNCVFLPPTIAKDSLGQNYRLIHASPNKGSSWAANEDIQKFGPWIIENGAGKVLEFTNVFDCHSLWPTFSYLGVYDPKKAN